MGKITKEGKSFVTSDKILKKFTAIRKIKLFIPKNGLDIRLNFVIFLIFIKENRMN